MKIDDIADYVVIETDEIILKLKSFQNNILYYLIFDKEHHEMGYCDLRLQHSAYFYYYGNIGYRINEPYRGNGYAGKATAQLIEIARKLDFDYLIITVSPENEPSRKTIQKLNFTYLKTVKVPFWHPLRSYEPIKEIYEMTL